eukprot:5410232-Pleurochrysis_carterae.AAC.2
MLNMLVQNPQSFVKKYKPDVQHDAAAFIARLDTSDPWKRRNAHKSGGRSCWNSLPGHADDPARRSL